MAKKKASPVKGKQVALKGSTLPALDDQSLRDAAAAALKRSRPATGGNKVSIKGKKFTYAGQIHGDTLRCSVVQFGYAHAYYEGTYNEKTPEPPVCFSLSMEPTGMVPHAIAPDKQHADCESCPHNAFQSATTGSGKGKACKDITRVVLIVEKELGDADLVNGAQLYTLDIPAKSLKGWDKYNGDILRKFERETFTILTELAFVEGEAYPVLEFHPIAALGDMDVIRAIKGRQSEAQELILAPWQPISDKRKTPKTGRAAPKRAAKGKGKRSSFG